MVAAAVVMLTGAVTITGQAVTWLAPQPQPARPVVATDRDFDAVAVPFAVDYLSWDEDDRASRQAALARSAAPDTTVDGWTGEGRQWADSATAIGIARAAGDSAGDRAVVTVRVRITPYSPVEDSSTGTSGSTGNETEPGSGTSAAPDAGRDSADDGGNDTDGGSTDSGAGPSRSESSPAPSDTAAAVPNRASGPIPGSSEGWVAGPPRWLNVAVPVAYQDGRVVVTAPPALVGSPQAFARPPAVPEASAEEDGGFARTTRATVTTLMRAYGSGDLTYARGPDTSYTGLNNAATVEAVTQWRVQKASDTNNSSGGGGGADGTVRVGDVTVTWALSGGAGRLMCTYRVELYRDGGRWYLASIGAVGRAVT